MNPVFDRFAAIDWSGAKGSRHRGIAVALCGRGNAAPTLVLPDGGVWSRGGVLRWVVEQAAVAPTMFGFDFSFAPPIVARGSYLPGEPDLPTDARGFWGYVDRLCIDEPDLGATAFLERHHRRHFYFGIADGRKADFMHLRRCEALFNARGGGKPSTVYDAIGAAQVAKASFAGMRLLHHLDRHVPVWPMDGRPSTGGSLVVEIYTSIAARAAGRPKGRAKMRDADALDVALDRLGTTAHARLSCYSDHATDAILTSAWLRRAADRPAHWAPVDLDDRIGRSEGWTFGID